MSTTTDTVAAANCTICQDTMGTDSHTSHTLPECGHCFHAHCLLQWFRSNGSCPLCRGEQDTHIGYMNTVCRYKMLRSKSRGKRAPPQLKKFVKRIQRSEAVVKTKKKELRALRACTLDVSVRQVVARVRRAKTAVWGAERRLSKLKRTLGMTDFETQGFRLPNVVLSRPRRRAVYDSVYDSE